MINNLCPHPNNHGLGVEHTLGAPFQSAGLAQRKSVGLNKPKAVVQVHHLAPLLAHQPCVEGASGPSALRGGPSFPRSSRFQGQTHSCLGRLAPAPARLSSGNSGSEIRASAQRLPGCPTVGVVNLATGLLLFRWLVAFPSVSSPSSASCARQGTATPGTESRGRFTPASLPPWCLGIDHHSCGLKSEQCRIETSPERSKGMALTTKDGKTVI